jgi:PAS domain S-box-containing protein
MADNRKYMSRAYGFSMIPDYRWLSLPAFVIDKNHTILYWNIAMELLSGVPKNRVTGTSETWLGFYRDERPTLVDLIVDEVPLGEIETLYPKTCSQSSIIPGALEADTQVQDIFGNVKWLHITASPITDAENGIVGAIETLEDISDKKHVEDALSESEKSYRALFESAYDAIWVHDMNGCILTANEALSELCGYPVQEMIGMSVKDFICGENDIAVARNVKRKLLDGGRIEAPYEMTLLRKDGSKLHTKVTTNLVNVKGFTGVSEYRPGCYPGKTD